MSEITSDNKSIGKTISPLDAWALAFGCMVGWGTFVMPGTTFLPVAGPMGTIIALLIGTAIMIVIGANFAFLMKRNPYAGGVYSYTKEAFGRDHAFISSWFLCLSYLTIVFLNGTALFVVIRTMFDDASQTGFHYTISGNKIYLGEIIVSALALVVIGLLFIVARPLLKKINTVLSIILILGIVIVAVCCIPHLSASDLLASMNSRSTHSVYGIFSIVFLAPWAFVGFEVIAFDTTHFKFKVGNSKRVIFTAILFAAFAYIAMTVIGVSSVPDGYSSWSDYISDLGNLSGVYNVPTFYAAKAVMGHTGFILIGITALSGILTGIIGGYRATTKILSAMAEDKILSEKFSKISYSIVFIMGLSVILALFGRNTLSWFVDLTSLGAIVGFGYTSASAYKIAKTEGNKNIKVTGIIGTAISVVFVFVQLIPHLAVMETMGSEAFLLLALWCLLGFLFYWRTVIRSNLTEYSGISMSGIVLFAMLLYSSLLWLGMRVASSASLEEVHSRLIYGGIIVVLIVFMGLAIMVYVQNIVRKKHEESERDKIRAMEGSLAKSQFLFNMSHDIRTPMNAIIGYTDLALKEDTSEDVHDYLVKIDKSNRQLLSLINDILEMSRIENGTFELEYLPTDLFKLLDDMSNLFDEQMKAKKIDFKLYTSHVHNRYAWCDVKNLNRVLLNLLSNAYKFTPEGGVVTASLFETGNGGNGYGTYELKVKDTGIGMNKSFVEKMFNPFERERTSTASGMEGTGLGLAITKSIVDLMGGTIEVITSPGTGTEIIIRLKLKLASEKDIPESKPSDAGSEACDKVDFSAKRLLLVEDNAINMEIAQMILTQAGFKVETAENGQIALDMVAGSEPGYYDAILMDIQMPVMDGYTATAKIRQLENKELADIPILAMTANAFKEDVEKSETAGMQAHIAKPIDVKVLLETLAKVLS